MNKGTHDYNFAITLLLDLHQNTNENFLLLAL